jgi:hypothetical protein
MAFRIDKGVTTDSIDVSAAQFAMLVIPSRFTNAKILCAGYQWSIRGLPPGNAIESKIPCRL